MKEYRIKGHVREKHSGRVISEFKIQKKYWLGWFRVSIPTCYSLSRNNSLFIDDRMNYYCFTTLDDALKVLDFLENRKKITYLGKSINSFLQSHELTKDPIYINLYDKKYNNNINEFEYYSSGSLDYIKNKIDDMSTKTKKTKYYE